MKDSHLKGFLKEEAKTYLVVFFVVFLVVMLLSGSLEASFCMGIIVCLVGTRYLYSNYKGYARTARLKKDIDDQVLYDAVRESFEHHHASSWIDILFIIGFIDREKDYVAKPEEIKPIIERLLDEGFIVKYSGGWQLATESSTCQSRVNRIGA